MACPQRLSGACAAPSQRKRRVPAGNQGELPPHQTEPDKCLGPGVFGTARRCKAKFATPDIEHLLPA